MKQLYSEDGTCCFCRRDFLRMIGKAAGSTVLAHTALPATERIGKMASTKEELAQVCGGFVYPP